MIPLLYRIARSRTLKSLKINFSRPFTVSNKWANGRLKEWGNFWYNVYADYKSVAVDVLEGAKNRPFKAGVVASSIGLVLAAMYKNPDEQSFHDHIVKYTNELVFVPSSICNPVSEQHLRFLTGCENQGLLRRINCILFSLIMEEDYSSKCKLYAAQCKYLKPKFITFHQRIVDIGVYDKWLYLENKMKDYDVNPEEWKQISA